MPTIQLEVDLDDPASCQALASLLSARVRQLTSGRAEAPALEPTRDVPAAIGGGPSERLTSAAVKAFLRDATPGALWLTLAIAKASADGRMPTGPQLRALHSEQPSGNSLAGWANSAASAAVKAGLGHLFDKEHDSQSHVRYSMALDVAQFVIKHVGPHVPSGGGSVENSESSEPRAASLAGSSLPPEDSAGSGTPVSIEGRVAKKPVGV